jgi:hypothetical protein
MTTLRVALLLAGSLCACSNYDFARAKLPSGEWDYGKLAADLKASGEPALHEGIWIPLIWLDLTTFRVSEPSLPAGHTLETWQGAGPLFCVGNGHERLVDDAGVEFERRDAEWYVWGVPYWSRTQRVQTQRGERLQRDSRILLLIDNGAKGYAARP